MRFLSHLTLATRLRRSTGLALVTCLSMALVVAAQQPATGDKPTTQPSLRTAAEAALRKAATFYASEVAHHGGYVYHYSLDLRQCWGEGKADRDTIWVQPPGTPTVGLAYLAAYDATGEGIYLDAARAAAGALIYGQLESGGWTNKVCFAKAKRMGKYRNGRGDSWNMSSLDDGQTQTALRFLVRLDKTLEFADREIHEAVSYGLDALLAHQFPNGAFPQGWDDDELPRHPPKQAEYPDYDWRTEGRIKNYWDLYTLNDDNAAYLADLLIEAHRVYGEARLMAALEKLGDFLILAQMPDPQPAWAQQYRYDMKPAWARRFEPPAITSAESMSTIDTLIRIYRHTGKKKYLQPIPSALDYLETCLLPDGRLARFYELRTNKPLYMKRKGGKNYVLTYDDSDLPGHYGWKRHSRLASLRRDYQRVLRGRGEPAGPGAEELEARVRRIIRDLDEQGRWVSTNSGTSKIGQTTIQPGQRHLSSRVFARNVEALSLYLRRRK